MKLIFLLKNRNRFLSHPFGELRVTYALYLMAHWKARDRFPIHRNRTFLLSVKVATLQGEICRKSASFEGGWVTVSTNFRRKGRCPPTTVGVRKLERLPLLSY